VAKACHAPWAPKSAATPREAPKHKTWQAPARGVKRGRSISHRLPVAVGSRSQGGDFAGGGDGPQDLALVGFPFYRGKPTRAWAAPQYPRNSLPLQRLPFGPIPFYGLFRVQARTFLRRPAFLPSKEGAFPAKLVIGVFLLGGNPSLTTWPPLNSGNGSSRPRTAWRRPAPLGQKGAAQGVLGCRRRTGRPGYG